MSEADVNAAMYVQFEADCNVIRSSRIAVGGVLSTSATAIDLSQLLNGRSHEHSTSLPLYTVLLCTYMTYWHQLRER